MTGTIINFITILIGSAAGAFLGGRFSRRLQQMVVAILGLFLLGYGLSLFLKTQNSLIVLAALLLGGLTGEVVRLEHWLEQLGIWLEKKVSSPEDGEDPSKNKFVRGFLTASLVFCIGPMAILGSFEDGLTGNYQTLFIKSILDGFASLAFASSLGIGVAFSSVMVLIYQGALTLLAGQLNMILTPAMITEMTATGGIIMLSISISSLLEIKSIRTGNLLPALIYAPVIVAILNLLGVSY